MAREATVVNYCWCVDRHHSYFQMTRNYTNCEHVESYKIPIKYGYIRNFTYDGDYFMITDTSSDNKCEEIVKISNNELVATIIKNMRNKEIKFKYGDIIAISKLSCCAFECLCEEKNICGFVYDGNSWNQFFGDKLPDKFTIDDKIVWNKYVCNISLKKYNLVSDKYQYVQRSYFYREDNGMLSEKHISIMLTYTLPSDIELNIIFPHPSRYDEKFIYKYRHHVMNMLLQSNHEIIITYNDNKFRANLYTNVDDLAYYIEKWEKETFILINNHIIDDLSKIVIEYGI